MLRRGFWLVALALLPVFVLMSRDFGATWDEYQQHDKARRLIEYWSGNRPSLDEPIDGAHLYGAPFDVVSVAMARSLGLDEYLVGHAVNSVVGWLGLVLAGLLAARLFDWRHGLLTVALLAVTPQYVAHSMNNPKDLPFATVATAALVAMTYVSPRPPFLDIRTSAMLALVFGLGLNVRAGTLLFAGYLAVLIGYYASRERCFNVRTLAAAALRIGAIVAVGVGLGWLAWPWAYGHPLTAPFRAMSELSHFPWGGIVLFNGADVPSDQLPWTYATTWMWLSLPLGLLGGAAAGCAAGLQDVKTHERTAGLMAVVTFPIVFVVATGATLYDGLRHLLFVVPPLAVLASAGWMRLFEVAAQEGRREVLRYIAAAALVAGLVEPAGFQWRNHPNQIAYIQPLAGGPSAAFGRFDLDYWGNCMLQSMTRLPQTEGARVAVTGWPLIVLQMDAGRFPQIEVVPDEAAYSIELVRGKRDHVLDLAFRDDVVDRVTTADGATLCVTRRAGEALRATIFP